jgi:hypothetical protein
MHEVVGIMTGAVVHDLEHPGDGDGKKPAEGERGATPPASPPA